MPSLNRMLAAVLLSCSSAPITVVAGTELATGIQDNSFLVEEAYNQEAGVVQHIFLVGGSVDQLRGPDERELSLEFTQEWPLFSQAHQVSCTLPYHFLESDGSTENVLGDIVLSYRYQALFESDGWPAFAPRVSLILPTGEGADDGIGYEVNLPFSKVLSNRWSAHLNAGATWLPDMQDESLMSYSLAGSFIYAISRDFHVLLEAVGAWDEEGLDGGGTRRDFSAIVSPGVRYAFNLKDDVQIVAGVAAPIGLTGSAPDYGILLYLSVEHGFLKSGAN
ncbi:MAG: transporter [Chthoniobacteraceae bacterium]